MAPDAFNAVEEKGACLDLSSRTKLLLTGGDRVRYLNGQITNDARKIPAGGTLFACVTSAKGRIDADVYIHPTPAGDGLLLDAEPGLREALAMRLEKYIVADDVELRDVTDEWKLLHVFGQAIAESASTELPEGCHQVQATRMGVEGFDLWVPAAATPPAFSCPTLSSEDAETLRILRGLPRWPKELNAETFPQEAGLEQRAMDFAKGCYLGQEILSRIKMSGKMPRVLMRWSAGEATASPTAQEPPSPLLYQDADGVPHDAGSITSAARHPVSGQWMGLGYVRQSVAGAHSVLLAGASAPSISVEVKILKA